MKTTDLGLSLSAVGASHSTPDNTLGSHCAATGYIRSDTRCAFRSGLLTQVRRVTLEARANVRVTSATLTARAEVLVYDAVGLASSAPTGELQKFRQLLTEKGRLAFNRSMSGFLGSLISLSTDVGLPETEAESQRMLWNYLQAQELLRKG